MKLNSFVCLECGKGYSWNYCLKKHLEEEHHACTIKRQKRFHCPICNQETGSFYTLLDMRKHCREEHQVRTYVHTHTHVHTYIHTYIHTYVCTYVRTYIHTHTYVHMYVRTYIHTYIRTYVRTCIEINVVETLR